LIAVLGEKLHPTSQGVSRPQALAFSTVHRSAAAMFKARQKMRVSTFFMAVV